MPNPKDLPHLCHARGCKRAVPRRMFMCAEHWAMVPPHLQRTIWATYRPGQERPETSIGPSRAYLKVARQAVEAVAAKEQRR